MPACVRCQHGNREGARFCAACGEPLPLTCPACAHELPANARFCDQCGTALAAPPTATPAPAQAQAPLASPTNPAAVQATDDSALERAEHRHLTVLFCDMVGSTELVQRMDAEDFRALNRRFQQVCSEAIDAHGGYVARYMGDGLLAYFGYPEAHEDDAGRAARAGLAMIEAVAALGAGSVPAPQVSVRVGIASGPVVVGDVIGDRDSREHAVVGETPNLAARLQQAAAPGTVVVSKATQRLLGGMFEQEPLEPIPLKGYAEPLPAWVVRGIARSESRFAATRGTRTAFVGRENELSTLEALWSAACEGQGQVALLSGEPGIGKSRLVEALRSRIESDDLSLVRYQCAAHLRSSALHPVIQQLVFAAGIEHHDDPPVRREKLRALVARSYGGDVIEEVVELFASLPGIAAGAGTPLTEGEAEARKIRTLHAIADGLEGLTRRSPLLLVIEDVHWADPTTLAVLDLVVERTLRWRALVMVTFRPEFDPPWTGMPHVTLTVLNRLSQAMSSSLVARLTAARQLPADLVVTIAMRADGIPLFLEELTQAVVEAMERQRAEGSPPTGEDNPALSIPATLQDSLMARLDQLGTARNVAQVGAVIGREFDLDLLAAVTTADLDTLKRSLARLEQSGLVRARRSGAGTAYVFKHALVRDAAYASLLRGPRCHWHARIARELESRAGAEAAAEPELVAWHFAQAGLGEEAAAWWVEAGRRARERFANEEAIRHLTAALDLLGERDREDIAAARQRLDILLALIACYRLVDAYEQALAALDQAEPIATKLGDLAALADVYHFRGNVYFPSGNVQRCLESHEQALKHARAAGSHATEARAMGGLGDAYYACGRMRTANARFRECVAFAREHDLADIVAANAPMIPWSGLYLASQLDCLELGQEAVRIARAVGHPRAEQVALGVVCYTATECGRFELAEQQGQQALDVARKLGTRNYEGALLYFLGRLYLLAGDHAAARKHLEQSWEIQQRLGPGFHGPAILAARACLAPDAAGRRSFIERAEALLGEGAVGHNFYFVYRDAMETALAAGDEAEVRRLAGALARYDAREPVPWVAFHVERATTLAAVRAGAGEAAIAKLDRLIAEAGEFGFEVAGKALIACRQGLQPVPGRDVPGVSGG